MIPGASDLIRFAVREAWLPELQAGCPQFVIDNMKYQGYTDKWTKYYWAAHWIIPTYEQARQAYWYDILTKEEFEALRKYADLSPSYDHVWNGLMWNYPGRVDSRWLREWGFIDHSTLVDFLHREGYHPDWTDKLASSIEKNLLRDEANAVRTALINLYYNGFMTKTKLISELTALGLYPESIPLLIQQADLKLELDSKQEYLKIYVTQLKKGKITTEVFISSCQGIGMTDEAITRQLDLIAAQAKT